MQLVYCIIICLSFFNCGRLFVVYCPGRGGGGATVLHFCDAGAHVKPFSQDHK